MFGPVTPTVTPGSAAPVVSFTTPVRLPVVRCAKRDGGKANAAAAAIQRILRMGEFSFRPTG
jgi:hypothetical protein